MYPWGKPKVQRDRDLAARVRQSYKDRILAGEVLLCGICLEPCVAKAKGLKRISKGGKGSVSVDHIVRLEDGGSDTIWNMQPAHIKCNQEKG